MNLLDDLESPIIEKQQSIQMITSFLNELAFGNKVYKFIKKEILYVVLKNTNAEPELQLIIVPEKWIPSGRLKKWLCSYLALPSNFKMDSISVEKFNRSYKSNKEYGSEMKIIDFTLEEKNTFKKLFLQNNDSKLWLETYDEYLSHKYVVANRKKEDFSNKYKMLFHKEMFKVNKNKKVCVVSPFTYGKSALINSLLGQKVLAEDILVKTAKVTVINHYPQFWMMKDGKQLFLEKYLDTSNYLARLSYLSSMNEEQGHIIHATINNPTLGNITLVDTPGLFGKFAQHDEITESIIKDVDHIIYLLSPTQLGFEPYTRKIMEWQKKYNKPCIFVMNKMDLVKDELDRQRLKDEFNDKLGKLVNHDGIIFVSAYSALKARLYKNNSLDLITLKKDMLISVKKDGEVLSGRSFTEDCVEILEEESGILQLESYFNSIYGG